MGMNPQYLGKLLMVFGSILFVAGVCLFFLPKVPLFGHLPGDIVIRRRNLTFYFPLATSLVLSAGLTLVFWLFSRR